MERTIRFETGLVTGADMRDFLEIFDAKDKFFNQRKQYDEYYYNEFKTTITMEQLEKLAQIWPSICITWDSIIIDNIS